MMAGRKLRNGAVYECKEFLMTDLLKKWRLRSWLGLTLILLIYISIQFYFGWEENVPEDIKQDFEQVFPSTSLSQARKIIQKFSNEIKSDMSFSKEELVPTKLKQDFIDHYKTNIVPRLETPTKWIHDKAIQWLDADWDTDEDIVFWTEGIWVTYGGIAEREFLYVVEMQDGQPINIIKRQLHWVSTSFVSDDEKYKNSMFFKYPNANCGYNDFVRGLLTVGSYGVSGSGIYRYIIAYNKYEQRIEIDEESSSVFLVPQACD
jgi:hypothetical protein